MVSYLVKAVRKADVLQAAAAGEGLRLDGPQLRPKGHPAQVHTLIKSAWADIFQVGRQGQLGQVGTVAECLREDGGKGAWKIDFLQVMEVGKAAALDLRDPLPYSYLADLLGVAAPWGVKTGGGGADGAVALKNEGVAGRFLIQLCCGAGLIGSGTASECLNMLLLGCLGHVWVFAPLRG